MGSLRDHVDLPGGLRAALEDEPPWWARGAIGVFAAAVVVVTVVSAVLGVNGATPRGPAGGTAVTPGGTAVAGPAGADGGVAPGAAEPPAAGNSPTPAPAGGTATVALADRDGRFRPVPRAAVDAARSRGAARLGLPLDAVRHHLVAADPGRVELGVSSLDGGRTVTVVVTEAGGSWRAA
ncbi:MAG TPA: hypothetical protein VFZ77_18280 [Acidimicrobiales bacterium]